MNNTSPLGQSPAAFSAAFLRLAKSPVVKAVLQFGCVAALMFAAATAQVAYGQTAVPGSTGIDASGNTQSEIAACNTGKTQQDLQTCLKEARNASADKSKGQMSGNKDTGPVTGMNALQRCDALQGTDKIACQARVAGYGTQEGSIAGGGVIRQTETVVVPADGSTVRVQPQMSIENLIVIPGTVQK